MPEPINDADLNELRAGVNPTIPYGAAIPLLIARLDAAEARVKELEADNAALRGFALEAVEIAWDGHDMDGGSVQEEALDCGLIAPVPGGFNPDIHSAHAGAFEPGDTYYMPTKRLKPLVVSDGGAQR